MENVPRNRRVWVLLCDEGCGRLLSCGPAPLGRCHVEEIDRIENTWEGHEHGRPSPLTGKDGHAYASLGHYMNERLDRFAREVAAWIEPQIRDHGIDRLSVFMAPRFLGAFRKARSEKIESRFEDHRQELVGLDVGELSDHPSICELVGQHAGTLIR